MKHETTRQAGLDAESAAAGFLERNGYAVLDRNYATPWGEIDIIAREKGKLCFVEVKMRSTLAFGSPASSVSSAKQRRIALAALAYMKRFRVTGGARFDVVSMVRLADGWKIDVYRNAFDFPW
jgi:putative endonuclease